MGFGNKKKEGGRKGVMKAGGELHDLIYNNCLLDNFPHDYFLC